MTVSAIGWNEMKLIEACILCSPTRLGGRFAGRVFVTTVPTPGWTFDYSHSVGSCGPRWTGLSDGERRELLRHYFTQIVREDGVLEDVARNALTVIDDLDPTDVYFVEDGMT